MVKGIQKYLALLAFISVVLLISISTFFIGKNSTKSDVVKEDCHTAGLNHVVEIENDQISPRYIDAEICDKLIIVNKDEKFRLMAFGIHDEHIYYNGITEKPLNKDQELAVTLEQRGTYLFHDHLQDEVAGQFNVR
jgi:hypothetical protein